MRPYDRRLDGRWQEYLASGVDLDPARVIERIANLSATPAQALAQAGTLIADLQDAIAQLQRVDWHAEMRRAQEDLTAWYTTRELCHGCERELPRSEMYWPECDEGDVFPGDLWCETCASEEEEAFWSEPWTCDGCGHEGPRRDFHSVWRSDEHPFAREGDFCAACRDAARVARRRMCGTCGSVYGVSRYKDTRVTCPACTGPEIKQEARVVQTHIARAQQAGTAADLTISEWIQTLNDFHGYCAYCQIQPYEVLEHFVPISRGGGTTARNCVPSCRSCNSSKSNIDPRLVLKPAERAVLFLEIRGGSLAPETVERVYAYLHRR